MRTGWLALLVAMLALTGFPSAGQGAARPAHIQIAGKQYSPLTAWARAHNLDVRWLKQDESLQLSNQSAKVFISVDSREAEFNGVQIWLLFPVVARSGTVYISQLDLDNSLQPILSPPRNRAGAKIKTICLDPGHGGKDPGYRVNSNQEKKYTLLLARELGEQLTRAGFKVTYTRNTDTFIELPERPELARKKGADLFVSLHFNSAGNAKSVRGAEVYCLTPAGAPSTNSRGEGSGAGWFAGNKYNDKNVFLAWQLQRTLKRDLATEDRGLHRARFAILRDAVMPAVLIEAGFMSHPLEGKKIFEPEYRRKIASSILAGIMAYKQAVEKV
jgi:N-acetylmuramoyl-L-alanine amidase